MNHSQWDQFNKAPLRHTLAMWDLCLKVEDFVSVEMISHGQDLLLSAYQVSWCPKCLSSYNMICVLYKYCLLITLLLKLYITHVSRFNQRHNLLYYIPYSFRVSWWSNEPGQSVHCWICLIHWNSFFCSYYQWSSKRALYRYKWHHE